MPPVFDASFFYNILSLTATLFSHITTLPLEPKKTFFNCFFTVTPNQKVNVNKFSLTESISTAWHCTSYSAETNSILYILCSAVMTIYNLQHCTSLQWAIRYSFSSTPKVYLSDFHIMTDDWTSNHCSEVIFKTHCTSRLTVMHRVRNEEKHQWKMHTPGNT